MSKIDESVTVGDESYDLFSYEVPGFVMKGYHHLECFEREPLPKYIYRIGEIYIEKTVSMVYGENTVAIVYYVRNEQESANLRLTPLVNFRDYHYSSKKEYLNFNKTVVEEDLITLKPQHYDIDISLYCSEGGFKSIDYSWFYNMEYAIERRGVLVQ